MNWASSVFAFGCGIVLGWLLGLMVATSAFDAGVDAGCQSLGYTEYRDGACVTVTVVPAGGAHE